MIKHQIVRSAEMRSCLAATAMSQVEIATGLSRIVVMYIQGKREEAMKKTKFPVKDQGKIQTNATFLDTDTGKIYKWSGEKWIQIYPKKGGSDGNKNRR